MGQRILCQVAAIDDLEILINEVKQAQNSRIFLHLPQFSEVS